jgi:hypothetical protein
MPSVFKLSTGVYRGTTKLASFTRSATIDFGPGSEYTDLPGIVTFRGNNYRDSASYGTADVTLGKLEVVWTAATGAIAKATGTGSWTGSGWTGQPLIVQWPEDLRSIMNISEAKKAEAGSETQTQLTQMADRVSEADRKTDFYEDAHAAGVTNLKLAYLVAVQDELFGKNGAVNFAAMKQQYPELFGGGKLPAGNAGTGGNTGPQGRSMNEFIRRSSGRG